jgi:hypothetical protein
MNQASKTGVYRIPYPIAMLPVSILRNPQRRLRMTLGKDQPTPEEAGGVVPFSQC